MMTDPSLPSHTLFRPAALTLFSWKKKLPETARANGACANSPGGHIRFLHEVASIGFLIIAIGPMPTERGEQETGHKESKQLLDAIAGFRNLMPERLRKGICLNPSCLNKDNKSVVFRLAFMLGHSCTIIFRLIIY